MIKFSAINALVHYVSAEIEIPSKSGGQSFIKRELIIDDSWERDGRVHPNFVLVEFTGDKMAMLNGIVPGHRVNLEGMLTGREYNGRVFNTAKGLSVSFYQAPQQPQQQQGTLYCDEKYPKPAAPAAIGTRQAVLIRQTRNTALLSRNRPRPRSSSSRNMTSPLRRLRRQHSSPPFPG